MDKITVKELEHIINTDCKEIAALVNARFEENREQIKEEILDCIREILSPLPPHYEWYDNGCPYDHSGALKAEGEVSLDQTVSQFLENEYSGSNRPTFESRCGLHWRCWGDEVGDEAFDMGWAIFQQVVAKYLSDKANRVVTTEDLSELNTDPVYELCYAWDFFCCEAAIEFVGIGDMLLSSVLSQSPSE